jgi:hypothetical protein
LAGGGKLLAQLSNNESTSEVDASATAASNPESKTKSPSETLKN